MKPKHIVIKDPETQKLLNEVKSGILIENPTKKRVTDEYVVQYALAQAKVVLWQGKKLKTQK